MEDNFPYYDLDRWIEYGFDEGLEDSDNEPFEEPQIEILRQKYAKRYKSHKKEEKAD